MNNFTFLTRKNHYSKIGWNTISSIAKLEAGRCSYLMLIKSGMYGVLSETTVITINIMHPLKKF